MSYALAGFGLGIAGKLFGFLGGRAEAKFQKKMQAYRNAMVRLADANNQNTLTLNSIQNLDQSVRKAAQIRRASMVAEGNAEVAAAAAGVTGNSVSSVMRGIQRSASRAEFARTLELKAAFASTDQQRQNSALSGAMQIDHTPIRKPSLGSFLLDAGSSAFGAVEDGVFDGLSDLFGSGTPAAGTIASANNRFAFGNNFGDVLRQPAI